MNRRFAFLLFIAVVLFPCTAQADPLVLKVALSDPESSEMGVMGKVFKNYLKQYSHGTLEAELYFNGMLGEEVDTVNKVRAGSLPLSCVDSGSIVPLVKKMGVLSLPYIFDDLEDVFVATTGKATDLLNSYCIKDGGFRIIAWAYNGYRHISNSKRPLWTLNDIKDLRIRVPRNAVHIATYQAWGATPVPTAWNKAFSTLQSRAADGQSYGYLGFKAMKFMEAHQSFLTEIHYSYQLQPLIMSERVFRRLTSQQQDILLEAGKAAQEASLQFQIEEGFKVKHEMGRLGLIVNRLEDESAWKEIAIRKVWSEMSSFVGGKDAINEFLRATGKKEWDPLARTNPRSH